MYTLQKLIIEALSISIPAVVIFECFYPYRKRALKAMELRSTAYREVGLIIFVLTIFGILAVTLWPIYISRNNDGIWGDIVLLTARPSLSYNVNLIPFRGTLDFVETIRSGNIVLIISGVVNIVGNMAMFILVGFFPALLFRHPTLKRSLLIGLSISLLIEICQYFIGRTVDIDDVILNTLGATCGYVIYMLIVQIWPEVCQKFQCVSNK